MASLQPWDSVGECPLLPRSGRSAGLGEASISTGQGPDGDGSEDFLDVLLSTWPLPAPLSPNPRPTLQRLRPVSSAFPTSLFSPPILSLDLQQSSKLGLPCGYWGAIPPKKRLSQEFADPTPPPPPKAWTQFLVPERGLSFPPAVYWTLKGPQLLPWALCSQPQGWGLGPALTQPLSSDLQSSR